MYAPKFFLSLCLFFGLFLISLPALAQAPADSHVAMRLLPQVTQVKGGDKVTVGIEQVIAPGWHTYWINPGDSGTATRIAWEADGIGPLETSDILWPAPKKLAMGPLTNFGYEDNVVLLQDIILPNAIPDGAFMVTATVDVLVCQEICIPETHRYSFALNGPNEPVPVAVAMAQTRLPIDVDWKATIEKFEDKVAFNVRAPDTRLFSKKDKIEIYPEEWGVITNTDTPDVVVDDTMISSRHKPGERALNDIKSSRLILVYEDAQSQRKAVRLMAEVNEDAGKAGLPSPQTETRNPMNIVQAALLALLGGLILNLMPCVFPVLSMKALNLVQLKDEEATKARWHGIFYTLGILFSFALVAAVLLSLKAGGAEIGWGFQLQNPLIILGLAYLFFILGLNLSGYFDIDFGLSNIGNALTERAGLSGSFFTGVLATIVATPCTAPFMAGAIGYAITQSAGVAITVFMALGLGLALPYLLLTMVPALRHVLPKPGAWMETFRQFLAFPMFASSLWLVWVLSQQVDHLGIFTALMGLLAIAFGLWLFRARPMKNPGQIIVIILSLLSFAYAVSTFTTVAKNEAPVAQAPANAQGAEVFSYSLLDEYLKQNHPVFINMTAAWCITCKVNEKVALSSKTVEDLFAQKGIKYLKGDWTNQNPEITKFLESYGRSGVPIYVYYGPGREPVVLPQILTPDIVQKAILGE